ncbi:calcium-binding protein [Jannaschia seohaensis]|uniref:Ca2+-binding RTX toxin-like protein n=1 Tax=Jannaschia seohaensis TaxID=475081 RepID=A0A2Y9AH95_9RHOB|nr:calcium-binding protein [Jannaschia seohaensis]PWJ21326.1 hypothetical protein BCF38_102577 [Jannaschia seohaensis]SSA41737.1 hypothetical protein SAMN05421539_102577 [Jannaschia seohaensis]
MTNFDAPGDILLRGLDASFGNRASIDTEILSDGRVLGLLTQAGVTRAAFLDAEGRIAGRPFTFEGLGAVSDVAATADGGFVAVSLVSDGVPLAQGDPGYADFDPDRTGAQIRVQNFDATGRAASEVAVVADMRAYLTAPKIAATAEAYAIVFGEAQLAPPRGNSSPAATYDGADLKLLRLNSELVPVGPSSLLPLADDDPDSDHTVTGLARSPDGGFAVVYEASDAEALSLVDEVSIRFDAYLQAFDADGIQVGGPTLLRGSGAFEVAGTGSIAPHVIALSNGDYAVSWTGAYEGAYLQTFDADGTATADRTGVGLGWDTSKRLAQTAEGAIVVETVGIASVFPDFDSFDEFDLRSLSSFAPDLTPLHAPAPLVFTGGVDLSTWAETVRYGDFALVPLSGGGVMALRLVGEGRETVDLTRTIYRDLPVEVTSRPVDRGPLTGTAEDDVLAVTLPAGLPPEARGGLLSGEGGDDLLSGDIGDDTFYGGSGADTMIGRWGSDAYYVDDPGDLILEAPGDLGEDSVFASVDLNLTSIWVEAGILVGEDDVDLTGNERTVMLSGNAGANVIRGGALGEAIDSGAGADTVSGGAGADTIDGGFGGAVLDMLDGDRGVVVNLIERFAEDAFGFRDSVTGFTGVDGTRRADNILGSRFADLLSGGAGDDSLNGAGGADTLIGGQGDDTLHGALGGDLVRADVAAPGGVVVRLEGGPDGRGAMRDGWGGRDVLISIGAVEGSAFDDDIAGNANGNRLDGGSGGADLIRGLGGDDTISGGGDGSVYVGGAGADMFQLRAGVQGVVTISDFEAGDRLALDDQLFGLGGASVDFREVSAAAAGAAVRSGQFLYDRESGQIRIDRDGAEGTEAPIAVAVIEGGGPIGAQDVLLF